MVSRSTSDSIYLDGGIAKDGEFYAEVSIGTPPHSFNVQVDTGSSDLLIYTSECSSCSSPYYSYSESSSSSLISCSESNFHCETCYSISQESVCGFEDSYGDGSIENGYVVSDLITIGDISGVRVDLGGIAESNTNGFEPSGVSGIWGLAYSSLSSWRGVPVFEKLVTESGISNIFSLCLTGSEGIMTMGIDYSSDSSFVWTPIIEDLWYVVQLNSASLGSTTLFSSPPPNGNAIIDSGTTLMLLPNFAYDSFVSYLYAECSTNTLVGVCNEGGQLLNSSCFTMESDQINAFPNFNFNFNGLTLSLKSSQYLYPLSSDGFTYYCMGIGSSGDISNFTIFGDVFMQNYHVVFDRKNSMIGFGPLSTCPTTISISVPTMTSSTNSQVLIVALIYFLFF